MTAAAALLIAAGCAKEREIPVFASDDRAIRIVPEISAAFTKSVPTGTEQEQTAFNTGDLICLSCEDGSMLYEYSADGWVPTDNYYLRWGDEPVTYSAYYPAAEGNTSSGFTVPNNQRNIEALRQADYMTCTVENAVRGDNGELRLLFERQMSKIIISVEGTDADGRVQAMRISSGQGIQGTDISATRIFVNPYTETPASGISGQEGTVYTAIVTPSAEQHNEVFATFVYGGKDMTVRGIPVLEAGKEYRLTMDIASSAVSFTDPADRDWSTPIIPEGAIQVISDSYYVKPVATGDGSGTDWDNAMDTEGLVNLLAKNGEQEISDINAEILDGSTIYMAGGTYTLDERLFIEYSGYAKLVEISIKGGYSANSTGTDLTDRDIKANETVISGGGSVQMFNFGNQTDVTFDGITFADGNGNTGAISLAHGNSGKAELTLTDCTVRDCTGKDDGIICNSNGILYLDNVTFTDNAINSRGIVKLNNGGAIALVNGCRVIGNTQTDQFGYAFHVSGGHLGMNNTVIAGNTGKNGAVNGSGSMCIVNSDIISNNQGGAIRCESAPAMTSILMNCIVINEMSGQNAVDMSNGTGYLTSRGFNLLGSGIHETNGTCTQFIVNSNDTMDCSSEGLGLVFDESLNAFTWDGNVSAKTTADDIREAIRTFRPEGHASLGADFITWLETVDGFSTDVCGNARDTGAMWPGAYQK